MDLSTVINAGQMNWFDMIKNTTFSMFLWSLPLSLFVGVILLSLYGSIMDKIKKKGREISKPSIFDYLIFFSVLLVFIFIGYLATPLTMKDVHIQNWEENYVKPYLSSIPIQQDTNIKPTSIDEKFNVNLNFKGITQKFNDVPVKFDVKENEKYYIEYVEIPKDLGNGYTTDKPYNVVLHLYSLEEEGE